MTKRGWAIGGVVVTALSVTPPAAAQTAPPPATPKAPVISDTARLAGPRQPIFFRHDVHAGQDQVPCLYCHASAMISSEPGIPAVQTCFGCHQMIGGSTPSHQAEIRKVREAWLKREPPVWVRVHALPGFVRFPHMRHLKVLGADACATCHGDVRTMPQVYQVATLKMGWCVTCHEQHGVSRDCTLCHY